MTTTEPPAAREKLARIIQDHLFYDRDMGAVVVTDEAIDAILAACVAVAGAAGVGVGACGGDRRDGQCGRHEMANRKYVADLVRHAVRRALG